MSTMTLGTRCKACDKELPNNTLDPELCAKCLEPVHEINQDLYEQYYERNKETLI